MLTRLLLTSFLVTLVGCTTEPMTPEQAAFWRQWGNNMQQQQRAEQEATDRQFERMQKRTPTHQTCNVQSLGFGNYQTECR